MYPQQSYPQQPPPPIAPPPAPVPPRGRTGMVLGALLAGVLLGAGGVAGAWLLTGDGEASGARADALAACGALERFDIEEGMEEGPRSMIDGYRWQAAEDLSQAAAEADARYRPLAETIRKGTDIDWFEPGAREDLTDRVLRHRTRALRTCGEL
ncbi:hypothetical protein [Streptomyces sp. JJ38]|uniref:hypothetical protein n=1 Tax=Streptomyces sp. JJ38 TaxID=2738128 RepID=UPI001C5829FA|nr:hypothetical protein [Streptomyces sp. JJ38]MBW1598277.1 hypothetical protein [Streptomyces sp. JJ38]